MLTPSETNLPSARAGETRIGDLISQARDPAAVVVGFPSDTGVERNGGRVGAAGGPAAIRSALFRYTPGSEEMEGFWRHTLDLGDYKITGNLEADQAGLADVLRPYLSRDIVCVVLGGGHETAYGHFLAHALEGRSIHILNVDAHPDVRPLIDGKGHSGSPFRQALEHGDCPALSYAVFGLAPHATANSLLEYLDRHPTRRIWNHEASPDRFDDLLGGETGDLMVTFDVDVFDQTIAPGVSAPTADGLGRDVGYRAAYSAGVSSRVRSFDVSEMNPKFDRDNQTARFAAMLVWHFIEGLATRKELSKFLHTQ